MSTTANTVELFGNSYKFRFGIKFQRIFMNHYRLKKIESYQKKMAAIDGGTLEGLEILGVVVLCAINAAAKKHVSIDPDDICDFISANGMEVIQPMIDAMIGAQPTQEEKPDAVGKSRAAG